MMSCPCTVSKMTRHYSSIQLCGLSCLLQCMLLSVQGAAASSHEVSGKVHAPSLASTVVYLHTSDGQKHLAYPSSDGSFTFQNLPQGSHLVQAFNVNAYFPEVQVDVGKNGVYRAMMVAQGPQGTVTHPLVLPLNIRPLGDMQYYEKRKPVDMWSILKSPYGLMIGFSLFIIVVMPKLKVDPEELKQMQAELRGQNKPSTGAAGSGATGPAQQRISNR